jgi:hypothetical protein
VKEIGLQPSTTGEPGGKETGQSVTHYILPGGPYAKAYAKLKAKGFQLHWQSAPAGQQAKAKASKCFLRRGRGCKNLHHLLLKAQRMAATRTEFVVFRKAA